MGGLPRVKREFTLLLFDDTLIKRCLPSGFDLGPDRPAPPVSPPRRSPLPSLHCTVRSRSLCSLDYRPVRREGEAPPDATHKGRTLSANFNNEMTYIKQFEAELVQKLESAEDTTDIVRWV